MTSQRLNKCYFARVWGACRYFRRDSEIRGVLTPVVRDLRVTLIAIVDLAFDRTLAGKCMINRAGSCPPILVLVF